MALTADQFEEASGFLSAHLRTCEQIRVLRLLACSSERSWTSAAVAQELRMGAPEAARALDHLCARNLLDVRISSELHFRYNPEGGEIRMQAGTFLRALDEDPAALARSMANQPHRDEALAALRDFADTFLLPGRGTDR